VLVPRGQLYSRVTATIAALLSTFQTARLYSRDALPGTEEIEYSLHTNRKAVEFSQIAESPR
jgi:hypothetical protein